MWEHVAAQQGFGWKFRTRNIKFADLDGDGLDNYVYVSDSGTTLWWRNRGTDPISWDSYRRVAGSPGITAVDVQFADVDGDGMLDYMITSQLTSVTRA